MRLTGFALMFAFALIARAAADEAEPGSDPLRPFLHYSLEELMAVEISAPSKFEQPVREAPAVATLITREQIEAYGWHTLNDVLLKQVGFAPSEDFERVTVSGRGQYESWNNNHLRVLIDGVPFNLVSNGTAYTWDMFPLSRVESIEIIRGPGSALYGSNATNGVIAINTRKASPERPVEAVVGAGDADHHAAEVTGGGANPWFSFFAGYAHNDTRGNVYDTYDGSGRTNPDGSLRKFEVNDRRSNDAGFLKVDGKGPLQGLSLQAHLAYWRFQTAEGWLFIVPDDRERASTNDESAWLTYSPPPLLDSRLQMEFVAQWMRHEVDYRIKYLPDGFVLPLGDTSITYPTGAVEIANTAPNNYFARGQISYHLTDGMFILLGVEDDVFIWSKDYMHQSNVDLSRGGTLQPFPGGEFRDLNPLFEGVVEKPIEDLGTFAQYCSGRFLKGFASVTAGVRYDLQFFDYIDLDQSDHPTRSRSLDQISPRLGLVFYPMPMLTLKAFGERAFRAPAPTELFVTNSLLGNSRTDQLKPEQMTTFTLAGDLKLFRHLNLRSDWFYQNFKNEIAFSATKNYSANLYSRRMTGLESEILFDFPLGAEQTLDGFFNYTLAHQLDEVVQEPTITASDRLTWAPENVFNLGFAFSRRGWHASTQGHFQGPVYRRRSDSFKADGTPTFFSAYRPASVDPWFTLDALLRYSLSENIRFQFQVTNLFDEKGYLLKTNDYPFDYQIEGRRLFASMEMALQGSHFSL